MNIMALRTFSNIDVLDYKWSLNKIISNTFEVNEHTQKKSYDNCEPNIKLVKPTLFSVRTGV